MATHEVIITPRPLKISESLEMAEFMTPGLPANVAEKAARAAYENRVRSMPLLDPNAAAFRQEFEYLKLQIK